MGQELGRVTPGQVEQKTFQKFAYNFFRVDSWMTFKGKTPYGQQKAEKVKKAKKAKFSPIGFRPPKPKPEQRM